MGLEWGRTSLRSCVWAASCSGFPCGAWAIGTHALVITARRLSSRSMWTLGYMDFSSCGSQAQELWLTALECVGFSSGGTRA